MTSAVQRVLPSFASVKSQIQTFYQKFSRTPKVAFVALGIQKVSKVCQYLQSFLPRRNAYAAASSLLTLGYDIARRNPLFSMQSATFTNAIFLLGLYSAPYLLRKAAAQAFSRLPQTGAILLSFATENQRLIDETIFLSACRNPGPSPRGGPSWFHIACASASPAVVQRLLARGIHVSSQDYEGKTPLFHACHRNDSQIVQWLLNHDSSTVHTACNKGISPLHVASKLKNQTIARMLLQKGANPFTKDKNGLTPVHLAIENQDADMLRLLVGAASRNSSGLNGALVYACMLQHIESIRILLENGANPFVETAEELPMLSESRVVRFTPLKFAIHYNNPDMLRLLVATQIDSSIDRSRELRESLGIASGLGNRAACVQILLAAIEENVLRAGTQALSRQLVN